MHQRIIKEIETSDKQLLELQVRHPARTQKLKYACAQMRLGTAAQSQSCWAVRSLLRV